MTSPAATRVRATQRSSLFAFFLKRRGDRRWDVVIRATGTAGLLGLPVVLMVPRSVPLVWLAVLGIPANSPLSPVVPAAFEPLIMEAAKHAAVLPVTLVALGTYLYMEYLNWHVYSWVLSRRPFARVREKGWVGWSLDRFARAPFATVVFFAVTPVPFWAVRSLAILTGYPLFRFMSATAVGRLPRLWFYAWLGAALRVPAVILLGVIVGTAAVVIVGRLVEGKPVLAEAVEGGVRR